MGQTLGDFFDQSKFQQKQKSKAQEADKAKPEQNKPAQTGAQPVRNLPQMPSMPNLGWKYQKEYFKSFTGNTIERDLEKLHVFFFEEVSYTSYQPLVSLLDLGVEMRDNPQFQTIKLTTTYPGLITGTGNSHETKKAEGELKLGFLFDHTTGLPYLAGSGVKGKLRSYFTGHLREKIKAETGEEKRRLNQKVDQIQDYFAHEIFPEWKRQADLSVDFSEKFYLALERELFEKRDVFLDAYICHVKLHREKTYFLVDDSITPHPHPLKNPIPLQFMKILPGVTFCFQFLLQQAESKEKTGTLTNEPHNGAFALDLTSDQKKKLLKILLLDGGIGAKTRHNYGQFTE